MPAPRLMRAARYGGRARKPSRFAVIYPALLAAALLMQGCAAPSVVSGAAPPDDPAAPVRAAIYRPVTAGYQSQRPAEASPWRERNDSVAPAPKTGGEP